jgi:O-antigen polymerase
MFNIILIVFSLSSAMYIPSAGGEGINLGYNILCLLSVGIAILLMVCCRRQIYGRAEESHWPVILGVVCIVTPWFFYIRNSSGCIMLALAFLCWWLSQKWYICENRKKQALQIIFILTIIQGIISLIQTFCPALGLQLYEYSWLRNHGRPYGIFQQVNLLGSFLATGLGCGYLLLLKEKRIFFSITYLSGLSGIAFTLSLNQSRAGMIGALLILFALTLVYNGHNKRKSGFTLLCMFVSAAAGFWVVKHTHVIINGQLVSLAREFEGSNHARFQIISRTVAMITDKPWLGWGYGSFEYEFSRFAMKNSESLYRSSQVITHPHNELLFAWFQGGVLALAGILLLVYGWLINWRRAHLKKNGSTGYTLLIIPLLVHLNLEYPFYQSFIHLAMFVTLLRVGEQDEPKGLVKRTPVRQLAMVTVGSALVLYSLIALIAHHQLTLYEREGYVHFPAHMPWYFSAQYERAHYDQMVALLIEYNQTHNERNLVDFMDRAQAYSQKHNDVNIWKSMIAVAHFQKNIELENKLKEEYKTVFNNE